MLREASLEIEATPTWALEPQLASPSDWQSIDQALRTIARRRAALDADEARWLREAEACQIWRPLGMVSAIDYMERVLGYAPRSAQERLRVARALGTLPQLTAALAQGELPFSAVRELTRVATLATEAAWVAAATGKNLRQIEELVADHRPGDAKGWQHGAGAKIASGPAAVERATCDAQHLGSIDDDPPARAYQDVPPSVARLVWRRDGGRCRVPGCRSARGLELHHVVHRIDGGSHDAANLVLVSAAHLVNVRRVPHTLP